MYGHFGPENRAKSAISLHRNREHVGIKAGIARLDAVESDLRQMFDKQRENPRDYYFQLLTDWSLVEKWCDRLRQIPEYIIDTAVWRIPT